jgi:hypothetical protein
VFIGKVELRLMFWELAAADSGVEEVEEREVFSRVCREGRVQANVLGAGSSRFRCKTRGKCLGSGDKRVKRWRTCKE